MFSTKTQGFVKRGVSLLLLLALLLPVLLVVPVSADTQMYLYNGVELPGLPVSDIDFSFCYIFPSWQTDGYFLERYENVSYGDFQGEWSLLFTGHYDYYTYDATLKSWVFGGDGVSDSFDSTYALSMDDIVWSNINILNQDGSIFFFGSNPVLIGGSNYPNVAETPTFTKNLTGAIFYYMQGSIPDPLTVEATVSDGGELSYEWFASDDVYQKALCTSNVFYPPTDTPGTVSYACKVTNRQYNPNVTGGYLSSSVYSFSDTISVVASSTDPTTPEETTPDYSGKFDDLQNSMDEMPGKITDGMQDIMDQEKEQATQQGGQFVDDITGVVPNDSQGFIDALGSLVSVLSYDGTECVLPIPALTLPAIGGLFPSYTVMQAQEVDFEEFFAMMPPAIMLLVQSLLTVALIVYCFIELYDTVAYFFVLKGGNK